MIWIIAAGGLSIVAGAVSIGNEFHGLHSDAAVNGIVSIVQAASCVALIVVRSMEKSS